MIQKIALLCIVHCMALTTIAYSQHASSLSLADALEIGIKNNSEIAAALQNVNAAHGRFVAGVSLPPPQVAFTYDNVPLREGLRAYDEKSFEVSQAFEFPAIYVMRATQGKKEKKMAQIDFGVAKIRITQQIKSAYFELLARNKQIQIAEENCTIAHDFEKHAEARALAGEATALEALAAHVGYATAKNTLTVAEYQQKIALYELKQAMGLPSNNETMYALTDSLGTFLHAPSLRDLIDKADKKNGEIQNRTLQVDISSLEKSRAIASFVPEIALGYYSKQIVNAGDKKTVYGASIGFSVPLYGMLDYRGKVTEASANLNVATVQLRNAQNSLVTNLQKAFAQYKSTDAQRVLYATEILPQAEEMLRCAKVGYESGENSYSEFLLAQQTLALSRGEYIDVLLSCNRALCAMDEAAGIIE